MESKQNKCGNIMKLVKKVDSKHVLVRFANGYEKVATIAAWTSGNIFSPYDLTSQGVGFIGEGPYCERVDGIKTMAYSHWYEMIRRCYSPWAERYAKTYLGCTVADSWHNFQNFGFWFDQNYYEVSGYGRMELDKDILHPTNKVYGPDTCIFVPEAINKLIILPNRESCALPPGIREIEKGKYCISIHNNGKMKNLGIYYSLAEAAMMYCLYKQKLLKEFAFNFKDEIPDKVYNALYSYDMIEAVKRSMNL